jgi:hypothetical protein
LFPQQLINTIARKVLENDLVDRLLERVEDNNMSVVAAECYFVQELLLPVPHLVKRLGDSDNSDKAKDKESVSAGKPLDIGREPAADTTADKQGKGIAPDIAPGIAPDIAPDIAPGIVPDIAPDIRLFELESVDLAAWNVGLTPAATAAASEQIDTHSPAEDSFADMLLFHWAAPERLAADNNSLLSVVRKEEWKTPEETKVNT